MNDRDRLIELLSENFAEFCHVELIAGNCKINAVTFDADKMADHLIDNGVTVQRHGRWKEGRCLESCSICGKKGFPDWHYCPACGAKMDEEE